MRAITFDKTLSFAAHHPDPVPADGDCLVRVHLAGVCSTDLQITRGYMNFSGVLGHEMVGTVQDGTDRWVGKRVVCEINCVCGACDMCQAGLSNHCRKRTVMGILGRDGCFADYVAVPERNLHELPENISDEEAVFVEPLAAAWQVVKQTPVEKRSKVAVVGSGRLGLLVAQVINTFGCDIFVVGRNPKTLLLAEKKHIRAVSVEQLIARNDRDLVVECTGAPQGMDIAMSLVRPRGVISLKSTYATAGSTNWAPVVIDEVSVVGSRCGPFQDAIDSLARKQVDVLSLVSKSTRIEQGVDAFEAASQKDVVKVLLKINPR